MHCVSVGPRSVLFLCILLSGEGPSLLCGASSTELTGGGASAFDAGHAEAGAPSFSAASREGAKLGRSGVNARAGNAEAGQTSLSAASSEGGAELGRSSVSAQAKDAYARPTSFSAASREGAKLGRSGVNARAGNAEAGQTSLSAASSEGGAELGRSSVSAQAKDAYARPTSFSAASREGAKLGRSGVIAQAGGADARPTSFSPASSEGATELGHSDVSAQAGDAEGGLAESREPETSPPVLKPRLPVLPPVPRLPGIITGSPAPPTPKPRESWPPTPQPPGTRPAPQQPQGIFPVTLPPGVIPSTPRPDVDVSIPQPTWFPVTLSPGMRGQLVSVPAVEYTETVPDISHYRQFSTRSKLNLAYTSYSPCKVSAEPGAPGLTRCPLPGGGVCQGKCMERDDAVPCMLAGQGQASCLSSCCPRGESCCYLQLSGGVGCCKEDQVCCPGGCANTASQCCGLSVCAEKEACDTETMMCCKPGKHCGSVCCLDGEACFAENKCAAVECAYEGFDLSPMASAVRGTDLMLNMRRPDLVVIVALFSFCGPIVTDVFGCEGAAVCWLKDGRGVPMVYPPFQSSVNSEGNLVLAASGTATAGLTMVFECSAEEEQATYTASVTQTSLDFVYTSPLPSVCADSGRQQQSSPPETQPPRGEVVSIVVVLSIAAAAVAVAVPLLFCAGRRLCAGRRPRLHPVDFSGVTAS
ncbi:hypothetical protein DIPPA_01770 [Diplonema papillatum]|nr:hypothetical protein DIPPA_01770 [Diplonema papillatum]